MGRPLKIQKYNNSINTDIGYPNWGSLTNPVPPTDHVQVDTEFLGVVGGEDSAATSTTYPIVKCRVFITGASAEADGWIIRQKGSTKYLVTDGSNTGVCILADEADGALTEGNMNITMSPGDSSNIRIKRLTNRFAIDYSDVKYAANFFTDDGTIVRSGAEQGTSQTLPMGQVESYT